MRLFIPIGLCATLLGCGLAAHAEESEGPRRFTAELQQPNTLGVMLSTQLADNETLASIEYLRISGPLGADDATLMKSNLTGLVEVDMAGVTNTVLPDGILRNTSNSHVALRRVVLPAGLRDTGAYTFSDCPNLTEVVVPATLTTIGNSAFSNTTSLTSIDFSGVTTIGENAFYYSGLEQAHLPASVTGLGSYAFSYCNRLADVTFGGPLQTVGDYVFYNCPALETLTLPVLAPNTQSYMFGGCTALREVTVPEGVTEISKSMFSGCTSLTAIELPSTVTTIKNYAFNNCSALAEVTLPEGLAEIGYMAFYYCQALTEVTIPGTVINLCQPFYYSGVKTITCKSHLPCYVSSYIIDSETPPADCVLRVPAGALVKYQTAPLWQNFATIETYSDDTLPATLATFSDVTFAVPAAAPADWRPAVDLLSGSEAITQYYYPNFYIRGI